MQNKQAASITDHRKASEKRNTLGYVLTRFENPSGNIEAKLYLALAFATTEEAGIVASNAMKRTDVLDVKIYAEIPPLGSLDEVTIMGRDFAPGWFELPKYKCASPNCPGYVFRASDRAHPAETCASSEKKAV